MNVDPTIEPPIEPPKAPLWLLRRFCRSELLEDVEGDLAELFAQHQSHNRKTATIRYWKDVLLLFRPGIVKNFQYTNNSIKVSMLQNFLKIAWRNALRHKGFTALNVLGLIVGITASLLILLWVEDEVAMDKFHENGNQIYQVFRHMRQTGGDVITVPTNPKPAADLMEETYPEVDQIGLMSWEMERMFMMGDNRSKESGRYITPEFLQMFSFELLTGDKGQVLRDPSSVLISERLAKKLYGDNWRAAMPLASPRILEGNYEVRVDGVFKDPGTKSSLQFEWLMPAATFISRNDWINNWGNGSFYIYFTTSSEERAAAVGERLYDEIKTHGANNPAVGDEFLGIQKFQAHYLNSTFENGEPVGGRITYVRIMTIVAIFILIVACINYMNLVTARSSQRAKEVGVRKALGARKGSLSVQFLVESLVTTTFAVVLSVGLILLLLPFFNNLTGKSISIGFNTMQPWLFLIGLILVVTFLSGIYPATALPKSHALQSMKGFFKRSRFAVLFRQGLVVFQFAISTLLIVGTWVVFDQLHYVLNKDLGLEKENMIAIAMEGDLPQDLTTYHNELRQIPEIQALTAASGNPVRYGRSTSSATWTGKKADEGYEINLMFTDENFPEVMGLEVLQGRGFEDQKLDSTNFLINEVAANLMGFDDPINKDLAFWGIQGKIVGVVKDFHMGDMYAPIAPLIITCLAPTRTIITLAKISGDEQSAILAIEEVTKTMNPNYDFEYFFLDDAYARMYESEVTMSKLSNIFAAISIIISCLGLFGLSAYAIEQRSKEIGIRKVHGASAFTVLRLLIKDFSKLIVIAGLIAVPLAYYFTNDWLANFEFRTVLNPFSFVAAILITLVVGVGVISWKSYQAARRNPVLSLREE